MMKIPFYKSFSILITLFLLFSSIIYLIPSFELNLLDKFIIYNGIRNIYDTNTNINFKNVIITPTYEYLITADSSPVDLRDKFKVAIHDAEIIRQRMKIFWGDNFEIKTIFTEDNVKHIVYLSSSIDEYSSLITSTNSDFKIFESKSNNLITDNNNLENSDQQKNSDLKESDVGINRSDFGIADVKELKTNENKIAYQVQLPISFSISYERLKHITNQLGKNLSIRVGGMEFQVFLDYNENYIPTALVVYGISDKKQALMVKAFLNSNPTILKYNLSIVTYRDKGINFFNFSYFFIPIILFLVALIYLKKQLINYKKFFRLIGIFVLFLSLTKLFNLNVSLHIMFLLVIGLLFSLLNSENIKLLFSFFVYLITLKLTTVLKGFDVTILSLFFILFFVFLFKLQDVIEDYKHLKSDFYKF